MNCDDDLGPVIPSQCYELRMYRWRRSRNRWQRLSEDYETGDEQTPTNFQLVTWNVNFDAPMPDKRMTKALRYLEEDVFKCENGEAPDPCVIMLQEVHVRAVAAILSDSWVREHFLLTPADTSKWPTDALYGNITLVEKSIQVEKAHILQFGSSSMHRTGLIVDVRLEAPKPHEYDVILRLINTHLESLRVGDDVRPGQLKLLSKFLKGPGVRGGVVAGDMNPIGPSDAGLPAAYGLKDAWRKGDKDPKGFTWGEQPPAQFPAARFDKILYLPRKGYRVEPPERLGVGLKLFDDRLPNGIWTSDHYGLLSTVEVLR
ncbi:hypothetical protein MIND_00238800 [Mycena indigotica]|uniref:Endonuclease/exonuclease/phosphatase domain-containing protein n=1 Tax=Mycena indigotica TaxID=2126181 RepID=A0A8H6WEW0_9AGAR|nr:uncharacterized protein MIND_00238800 [Mycena indigotica]KAF7312258.1 hypothetical protein MIND_00238800 [Mycena indigotica]